MRYGVMHRNTFLNSPENLNAAFQMKTEPRLFFAGQMTGVEGYMESAMSGLLAGKNALRYQQEKPLFILPKITMSGALAHYVEEGGNADFQPMGANFGILPPLDEVIRDKKERYSAFSQRALKALKEQIESA